MDRKSMLLRRSARLLIWLWLLMVWLFPMPVRPAAADDPIDHFNALQVRLVADGFDRAMIRGLYARPEVAFDTGGVSTFFTYRESRLNYDQFTSRRSIRRARKYAAAHSRTLLQAEKQYGVDPQVITAIILVETKLGTYLGNRSILNTLSTMASLVDPTQREMLWEQIPKDRRISRKKYTAKADTKSRWAYTELKAFLKHAAAENLDPCRINGSFAGAMGIAQFMPSNALTLARDGNGDGRVDLFDHDDAIASIANYLKHYGWRPGLDRENAYRILLRYNYSKYYVNTILKIAEKLKG